MKYIVEVKYTNPAHEHVSLRRRVDTVKRVVEAASEAEAINRATRQQKALGFLVKESAVVNPAAVAQSLAAGSPSDKKTKKIVGDEGETEIKKEPVKEADSKRYMRPVENQLPAGLDKPKKKPEETKKEPVKEEAIDEARPMSDPVFRSVATKALTKQMDPNFGNPPNKLPAHIKAAQAKSDALSKVAKRPQAGTLAAQKANEEVEVIDEGSMDKMTLSNLWNRHGSHYYASDQGYGHGHNSMKHNDTAANAIKKHVAKKYGQDVADDMEHHSSLMTSSSEYLSGKEAKQADKDARDLRKKHNVQMEEVVVDEAANDWKKAFQKVASKNLNKDLASVRASVHKLEKATGTDKKSKADEDAEKVDEARKMSRVEWRMGTQDTVDANNYKIFKKLSATDPIKAKAFHDNLLKMKKKDVKEEVEDKKASKGRKAAERMVDLAKSKKNQINLEPSVDTHKVPMLPTTMGK